jgi:arylsulfatase A-like enzyme
MQSRRRQWLKQAALLAAAPLLPRARASARIPTPDAQTATPPNLLFVFPDQMRRHAMGFTGEDPVVTPHLDRFATQSLYLPHTTATFPVCTPWRGMMMTGRYPAATGLVNNCNSTRPGVYLRRSERCVTDVLHDSGYHVGYIGKWHLTRPVAPYLPQGNRENDIAWDEFTPPADRHHIDYWHAYNAYDEHLRPRYWDTDSGRDGYRHYDEWSPIHETDRAIAYLENTDAKFRDPRKPFALWVSMNPPHPPYNQVPDRHREPYRDKPLSALLRRPNVRLEGAGKPAAAAVADYFAAVTGVDEQFGRILATLDRLRLAENTIVVFTSDHGDMMGGHALMGKPHPYEEAFNTPFLLRWPGRVKAAASDDLLLSTPDLMPTLLGLLGLRAQIPRQVQGADYSALLLGHGGTPRPAFAPYMDSTAGGHRGVRTHTHTLCLGLGRNGEPPARLYDNRADPFQLRDIAPENPALIAALAEETRRWLERAGDPWRPPDGI